MRTIIIFYLTLIIKQQMHKKQFETKSNQLYKSLLQKYYIIKNLKSQKGNQLNGKPCQLIGYQLFPYVKLHVKMVLPELKDSTTYKLNPQNLENFPDKLKLLRCSNHQACLNQSEIYYKCSICPEYYLCEKCQTINQVHYQHPEHIFLKIRPIDWEPPLPFDLEIKQTKKTIRKNEVRQTGQEFLLTPKQAAVYDELKRMDQKRLFWQHDQQQCRRFNQLIKWFRDRNGKAYYGLID